MLNATVAERQDITPELIIFRIRPDAGVADFQPGQYVALGLFGSAPRPAEYPAEIEAGPPDKLIKRAYSIGSSPAEKNHVEFYIAISATGALTSRLVMLKPGDRLFMAAKITGTFTVGDVPADHNLVLISTGTGIAPYMSMLRTPAVWQKSRKITLVHGVRYSRELAYRGELEDLAGRDSRFTYLPIVSREDAEWNGARGHVQKLFKDGSIKLNPALDHVFICFARLGGH